MFILWFSEYDTFNYLIIIYNTNEKDPNKSVTLKHVYSLIYEFCCCCCCWFSKQPHPHATLFTSQNKIYNVTNSNEKMRHNLFLLSYCISYVIKTMMWSDLKKCTHYFWFVSTCLLVTTVLWLKYCRYRVNAIYQSIYKDMSDKD